MNDQHNKYQRAVRNGAIVYGLFIAVVFLAGVAFGMLIQAAR